MSDWDASEDEAPKATTAPKIATAAPVLAAPLAFKSRRFEGEDEEEEGDDDWDVSDSEKKKSTPGSGASTPATAIKKKRNLKTVLAEKEAKAALAKANGDDIMDDETPQEKRRREKAQQEAADAEAAADFVGGDSGDADINDLLHAQPKGKDEMIKLAQLVGSLIFERLHEKPLYSVFAEEIARQAVVPLKDVDTRKIGSAITAVASEKTKDAKDKASGKKKVVKKPALGANKRVGDADTTAYDEALDDDLDFM